MNRRGIFTICTVATALFLIVIGILHGIVNVSSMSRAVGRGEIPARLEISAFPGAGVMMNMTSDNAELTTPVEPARRDR